MTIRPSTTPLRATSAALVLARDRPAAVVRAATARGELKRVGRGLYVPGVAPPSRDAHPEAHPQDEARRIALAHALGIHHRLTAEHVLSHATAALLWGLPLWRLPDRTSVRVRHSAGRGADPRVQRRVGLPGAADVVLLDGVPVTSLARTLVDCALDLPPLDALVVADAALRAGADHRAALALLEAGGRRPGLVQAREIVRLADPGAESPGESAARFVVLRDGFPVPTTQLAVRTRLGTFWTDIGWTELRLAVEYDGRVKYTDREALVREKRRHDAIVEAGWRVLRATKEDLAGRTLTDRALGALPAPARPHLTPRRPLRP